VCSCRAAADQSPYAFMGVSILRRYRDSWGDKIDVEFIPFFLGGIMVGAKNRPPAFVPGIELQNAQLTSSQRKPDTCRKTSNDLLI
jgi:hypothetical protein